MPKRLLEGSDDWAGREQQDTLERILQRRQADTREAEVENPPSSALNSADASRLTPHASRLTFPVGSHIIEIEPGRAFFPGAPTTRPTVVLPDPVHQKIRQITITRAARDHGITIDYLLKYALWKAFPELFEEEEERDEGVTG